MDDDILKGLPDFGFEPSQLGSGGGGGAHKREAEGAGAEVSDPEPGDAHPAAGGGSDVAGAGPLDLDLDLDLSEIGPVPATQKEGDLEREIKELFVALVKTIRATQLYVQGNPLLHRFFADLSDRMGRIWPRLATLTFSIHENEIRWMEVPVYRGRPGGHENVAFQLYRDGIRRIEFLPGVEERELQQFIDVLRLARGLSEDEDDLLTLIWNCDFSCIRYEYVDVLGDEPPMPVTSAVEDTAGTELPMLPELELSPELQAPTLREDFEPSLYFLDEKDVSHLQQELLREWERPIKRDVTLAILDQYEMGDEERRSEILRILRQMLPRVLAEGEFGDAAFLVAELQGIAERKNDAKIGEQVDEIIAELSQPIVVEQLIRLLEDGVIDPHSEELATLLHALKSEAIIVLMQALPLLTRQEAVDQLAATMERLAGMNPELIASLVRSEDPRVAAETAKIAARLKLSGAAEAVAALLARRDARVRLAAVEALVALRTSVAGNPLLRALEDENRDVRVAAARGLAELRYRPGAEQLEKHLKGSELKNRDLTEQLAFFEAYALAAGEDSVKLLSRLLNGRRYLWVKYSSQVRACAARALGLVGGSAATEALEAAARDRDAMVLSAVHAASRAPGREDGLNAAL